MNICSIRGAITIEENTKESIIKNTEELLKQILYKNDIKIDDIINIIFTATNDITKAYPAIGARNIGITNCAIMCFQELFIEDSLPMCIRAMLTVNTNKTKEEILHIYLKDAKKLRPDLIKNSFIAVAIDGPAGAGKSTISNLIAKEINFTYIDTGAMFRAVAYYLLQNKINYENKDKIINCLNNIDINIKFEDFKQQIYLNNKNITKEIRTQEISKIASFVAQIQEVRQKLINIQKNLAQNKNVIMDGRDIGTNVLPDANLKIYLDASIEKRAKRRFEELFSKDKNIKYEDILLNIKERDKLDKERKIAPLIKASDAIYIDTSELDIYEVSEKIINLIKQIIK